MQYFSKIRQIRETDQGTDLIITIPGEKVGRRISKYKIKGMDGIDAELKINDGRTITVDQRKKIYATIRDISYFIGDDPEFLKEYLKYDYCATTGEEPFSLSNCSVTVARLFINFLIEFAFYWDIPLQDVGLNRTDDISKYLWLCIKFRKCCICGEKAEIHHVDTIGIGRDRKTVDDSNYRKMALCRNHHTELHAIGKESFEKKYYVYGVTYNE